MSDQNSNICEERVYYSFYEKHSKDLYNFLYYKFGAQLNPSDIVQEAFIKLWQNCKQVVLEKAKSFLFTVANNHMLNEIAKEKTRQKYSTLSPKDYTNESPEFLMQESEYHEKLKEAINGLSEEMRATFLLNRIEGKKHQEIADMLGISKKAVEKRIYKALSIIREKVEGI